MAPEQGCVDPNQTQSLSEIPVGEAGIIGEVRLEGKVQGYVMRFGLVEGALVSVVRRVPLGSLRVYRIGQSEIALRPETAKHILVTQKSR